MRDRDRFGNVLASRQVDDGKGGRRGMRLEDFLRAPSAILAGLSLADVASVRIYSTAAFRSINNPLRDMDRHLAGMPHPLPVTVSFLQDAVKKVGSSRPNPALGPGSSGASMQCLRAGMTKSFSGVACLIVLAPPTFSEMEGRSWRR